MSMNLKAFRLSPQQYRLLCWIQEWGNFLPEAEAGKVDQRALRGLWLRGLINLDNNLTFWMTGEGKRAVGFYETVDFHRLNFGPIAKGFRKGLTKRGKRRRQR
jgi:hypothetical protein